MQFRINRLSQAGVALAASAGALFATAGVASAATYSVTTTTDGGAGSLRAAIVAADAAGGSSTINVPAGTYTLTIPSTSSTAPDSSDDPSTGDLDIDNNATITIIGAGAGQTIIDGGRQDRALAVHAGAALSISDVTIQHGESDGTGSDVNSVSGGSGGAIYNDGSLTVSDSALVHDTAGSNAGAIYSGSQATSTTVSGSTLSSDSSGTGAGAVYVGTGPLSLSQDTFNNDSGFGGGGVEASYTGSTVSISDSTFSDDNGAYSAGGALFISGTGATTVDGSTFTNDTTPNDDGGAIYLDFTDPATITDSTFTDDAADSQYGGAIYTDQSDISVSGSSFTGDQSAGGGAIYVWGSAAAGPGGTPNETLTNDTFTGNTAYSGGAIYDNSGYLSLTGSTLTQNQAFQGGALYDYSGDGLTLAEDTMTQNTGSYGGAALWFNTSAGADPIVLNHDTIADNTTGSEAAVYDLYQATTVENTIIADNTSQTRAGGADCYNGADYNETSSPYTDAGHNLDSDGSCFGGDAANGAVGDLTSVDPQLSPLDDNGGPVWTMALQAGSPAIGTGAGCTGTDARGIALPSTCDIGAFQTAATDLAVTGSGPASGVPGAPLSYTFTVTNNGPGDDAGVALTDPLPAGVQYFGASASQGTCTGSSEISCDLGSLDSGESATVTITVVPQTSGTVSAAATVSGAFTDPVSNDDRATVTTSVTAPAATTAGTTTTTTTTITTPAPQVLMVRPSANGARATRVRKRSTTLLSYVDAGNSATTWWFQYGKSRHLGRATRKRHLHAGITVRTAKVRLTHLRRHTTYYFRIVLKNAKGEAHSRIVKFKTH